MGLILQNINYLESLLDRERIVYLDFPQGSGRTYILKSLYNKLKSQSIFTHYASHRTPIGEFFLSLLNLIDKKRFLDEKGHIVGPILRRYIHPRFLCLLKDYDAEEVITKDAEISQILDIIKVILERKTIKYWFFDNWQEYLYFNEIFSELIPYLRKKYDIRFLIAGKDFALNCFRLNPDKYVVPITKEGIVVYEMSKAFNITPKEAKKLYNLSKGNWNNAEIIFVNQFKPLDEIIHEKVSNLSESDKNALFTFTIVGKTFSSTTIKAVKDIYGPLKFMKEFAESRILKWEYPLWRFASEDVLNNIRSYIKDEKVLREKFAKKLSSYNYSDLWGRLALLSEDDIRSWTLFKLKEYRSTYNLQRKSNILKEILQKEIPNKDLYRRELIDLLINFQEFSWALELINDLEKNNLLDLATKVRCLSYLGKYEEAEEIIKNNFMDISVSYETPEILSRIGSYYFLSKKVEDGLYLFNKYLDQVINLKSSPKYLANFYNMLGLLTMGENKYEKALSFFETGLSFANKTKDKVILHKLLNNIGDLKAYLNGPRASISASLKAYELSKYLSPNLVVISLGNLIKNKIQYCNYEEMIGLINILESLLEDIKFDYFLYSGYRRLAISYLSYGKLNDLERIIQKLEEIKNIKESEILVKILKTFLNKEYDISEEEVLNTKEEQIITLYMKLSAERGFDLSKSLREYPTDFPLHVFLKGFILRESFFNLIGYIDEMLERWEFLDALYSYMLLDEYMVKREFFMGFLPYVRLEAFELAILLGIEDVINKIKEKMGDTYKEIIQEHSKLRALDLYMGKALMEAREEEEAMEIIYRILTDFLEDFMVRIDIGDRVLEKGNRLLYDSHLRPTYRRMPYTIKLYSLEKPSPKVFFIMRNILKNFIIFWEKKYGIYDPLTGIFNRSYGERKIEEAFSDFVREKEKFSVVFIDIDSFKKINDTLGHLYGDYLLKEVANIIKNSIRQNDSAIRWGGDEFLVILRKADYDDALKVVERIKMHIDNSTNGKIKISYGIETSSEDITSPYELISRADFKMYKYKYERGER